MSGYFKGESNFHYHYSVNLKELPFGKRVTAVLCVVLWVPFAALLFLTSHYLIGIMGLVGAIFIYIPLASMYIAGLRGRQRMVPLIMLGSVSWRKSGCCQARLTWRKMVSQQNLWQPSVSGRCFLCFLSLVSAFCGLDGDKAGSGNAAAGKCWPRWWIINRRKPA